MALGDGGEPTAPAPGRGVAELPPRMIAGRYRLGRFLGAGGFGIVYEAIDERIEKTVAVKLLGAHRSAHGEDALERFRTEALAASRLNHPNIVNVTDFDVLPDGKAYLVMEYVSGATLAQHIAEHAPLDPARAARIAIALCSALAEAHDSGVVHRDLKPANVIVGALESSHLTVKILDFGVAKIAQGRVALSQSHSGHMLGTPAYMAPEQIKNDIGSLDGRADIYSVGMVLYEMLTGRTPFQSRNIPELLMAQLQKQPPPPSQFRADVPARLEAIVLKAIQKKQSKRFESAREMAEALEAWVDAEPSDDRRDQRPWFRRAAGLAVAAAFAMVPMLGWTEKAPQARSMSPVSFTTSEAAPRQSADVVRVAMSASDDPAMRAPRRAPTQGGATVASPNYHGPDSPMSQLSRGNK